MVQISFTSKIIVNNDFNTILERMYDKNTQYCEQDENVKGKNLLTTRAATCIAGGATNKDDAFMLHYCDAYNFELNEIYDNIKTLKSGNKKTNALITGGFGSLSEHYYKKIMAKIEDLKIETSVLFGQKEGDTSIHYSAELDTWTVNHDGDAINSLEDLKKVYKIVEIADCDQLWINNKLINTGKKLLQQSF